MVTIETIATVSKDGTITAKAPAFVPLGKHRAVIVLEDALLEISLPGEGRRGWIDGSSDQRSDRRRVPCRLGSEGEVRRPYLGARRGGSCCLRATHSIRRDHTMEPFDTFKVPSFSPSTSTLNSTSERQDPSSEC